MKPQHREEQRITTLPCTALEQEIGTVVTTGDPLDALDEGMKALRRQRAIARKAVAP